MQRVGRLVAGQRHYSALHVFDITFGLQCEVLGGITSNFIIGNAQEKPRDILQFGIK